MSTKYIASNWRLPNQENSSKSDNYGLSFDGSSELINCGDSDIFSFGDGTTDEAFSVSAWIKMDTITNFVVLSKYGASASLREYAIGFSPDKIYILLYDDNGAFRGRYYNTSTTTNDWLHIATTYNGVGGTNAQDGIKIYINGTRVDDSTYSSGSYTAMSNTTSELKIGNFSSTYADGFISEVAIFNYTLSESQISTLYGSSELGSTSPMALKPQPVGYWPLGDNSASNPLTQPNEAVEDASVFDFDGSNDFIDLGTTLNSMLQLGDSFSVSAWINFGNTATERTIVSNMTTSVKGFQFRVLSNEGIRIILAENSSTFLFLDSSSLAINTWHHAVFTYDGSNTIGGLNLYINSSLDNNTTGTSGTLTTITSTDSLKIGAYTSAHFFEGNISNAQIWNTSLSASEVTTLYNSGVPLLTGTQPQASSLKAWYKLDQSANWEADSSGDWQIPDAVSAYPQSFSFDAQDYIEVPQINTTGAISISGWVKTTDANYNMIYNEDEALRSGGNRNLFFSTVGSVLRLNLRFDTGTSVTVNTSGVTLNDGNWHHVAGVWNGTTDSNEIKLFVDGILRGQGTATETTRKNFTMLGNIGGSNATYDMNGQLSNIQTYTTGLSYGSASSLGDTAGGQIAELYNNGTPLTTAIATDNLKGWWKLDNTATFSTNWSIPDASGNGNTGTSSGMTEQNLVNNNVSVLNGASSGMTSANLVLSDLSRSLPYGDGYSFNFDSASSDYIDCGNDSTFDLNNAFSISTWVKYTSTSAMVVLSKRETTKISLLIELGSGKPFTAIRDASSNIAITNTYSGTYNDGNWHHIVATFNRTANELKLYVDNELKETANTSSVGDIAPNTNNLMIGRRSDTSSSYFDGKISNCSLFNETLTPTEVQKLYANGVPQDLTNFNPQPQAWYPLGSNSFWNGSAWTVRDMIGSNDGTGVNLGQDALVGDSPRSSANGTGTNMDVPSNLEGSTKWSDNNSWSINMSETARVEDTP